MSNDSVINTQKTIYYTDIQFPSQLSFNPIYVMSFHLGGTNCYENQC